MSFSWEDYSLISEDIKAVKKNIINEIETFPKQIRWTLSNIAISNAKFLRSGFFLLCSKIGDKIEKEKILKLATVIEMFHLATLIHDDIIDDSETRRNMPAFHIKYGKRIAVLTGDYLFLKCYDIISKYIDLKLINNISILGLKICSGEIEQAEDMHKKQVSILRYLRRISGKTASLFSFSFFLGGYESGVDQNIQKILYSAGYAFGMSFQIIDDILDYTNKEIGKNTKKDLLEGIYTLPVLYALKKENTKLKTLLNKKRYSKNILKKIIIEVEKNNGIKDAMVLAEKYTKRALKFLANLPESEAKKELIKATGSLLNRNY